MGKFQLSLHLHKTDSSERLGCCSYYACVGVFLSGKVSIRKDDLCKYSGKEHWFGIQPVDPNSEVQVIFKEKFFIPNPNCR